MLTFPLIVSLLIWAIDIVENRGSSDDVPLMKVYIYVNYIYICNFGADEVEWQQLLRD